MDAAATITATASFTGLATHLQGTGVSDYGDILFAPCTQFNRDATNWSDRYASRFSHTNEEAHAGYYQVYLEDQHIDELTTTKRVGIHQYRLMNLTPCL